jgi:hypothetical protein
VHQAAHSKTHTAQLFKTFSGFGGCCYCLNRQNQGGKRGPKNRKNPTGILSRVLCVDEYAHQAAHNKTTPHIFALQFPALVDFVIASAGKSRWEKEGRKVGKPYPVPAF